MEDKLIVAAAAAMHPAAGRNTRSVQRRFRLCAAPDAFTRSIDSRSPIRC